MQAQPQQLEDRHQGSTITSGAGGTGLKGHRCSQGCFPHCVRLCEETVSRGVSQERGHQYLTLCKYAGRLLWESAAARLASGRPGLTTRSPLCLQEESKVLREMLRKSSAVVPPPVMGPTALPGPAASGSSTGLSAGALDAGAVAGDQVGPAEPQAPPVGVSSAAGGQRSLLARMWSHQPPTPSAAQCILGAVSGSCAGAVSADSGGLLAGRQAAGLRHQVSPDAEQAPAAAQAFSAQVAADVRRQQQQQAGLAPLSEESRRQTLRHLQAQRPMLLPQLSGQLGERFVRAAGCLCSPPAAQSGLGSARAYSGSVDPLSRIVLRAMTLDLLDFVIGCTVLFAAVCRCYGWLCAGAPGGSAGGPGHAGPVGGAT